MKPRPMKEIPIGAARRIASRYGYDQVVILARRCGEPPAPFGEYVTTYGADPAHCNVAARIGDYLKFRVMNWPQKEGVRHEAAVKALREFANRGRLTDSPIDDIVRTIFEAAAKA